MTDAAADGPPTLVGADSEMRESFLSGAEDPLYVSLTLGVISGFSAVLIGYPFDSVKVRLQMGQKMSWRLFNYPYRGLGAPLLAVPLQWTGLYGSYGMAKKVIGRDDLASTIMAGGISGVCASFFANPFENVKVNAQAKRERTLDCAKRLIAERGVRGLFRGQIACTMRDSGQNMAFFYFAELAGRSVWLREKCGEATPFAVGMVVGLTHIQVELPFDCIKTRMQNNPQYTGYRQVLGETFKGGLFSGVRSLYGGWAPWNVRAIFVHGSSFFILDKARTLCGF